MPGCSSQARSPAGNGLPSSPKAQPGLLLSAMSDHRLPIQAARSVWDNFRAPASSPLASARCFRKAQRGGASLRKPALPQTPLERSTQAQHTQSLHLS